MLSNLIREMIFGGKSNWSVGWKRRVTHVFLTVQNPGAIYAAPRKRGPEIHAAAVTTAPTTKAGPSEAVKARFYYWMFRGARLETLAGTRCRSSSVIVNPPHKLGGRRTRHHSTSGTRPVLQPRPRGGFDVTGGEESWRTFLF